VQRVQFEAGVRQPLGERVDRARIGVVEVRTRGKHLDRVEAMGGDVDQMLAGEALGVEEVRRDAEAPLCHGTIIMRRLPAFAAPPLRRGSAAEKD
jgi:hypothetical protein